MRMNDKLLEMLEEFFDLPDFGNADSDLDEEMYELIRLVERSTDGLTNHSSRELADEAREHLERIWDLLPKMVKRKNWDLTGQYEDIMTYLDEVEDYEFFECDEDDSEEVFYDDEDEDEEESWD